MPNEAEPPDFLVHRAGDNVAVAVRDLHPGTVAGGYLSGGGWVTVQLAEPVPLGHKFALREIGRGADVIEYGVRIAVATSDIAAGQHAHVHNLRSVRWQHSEPEGRGAAWTEERATKERATREGGGTRAPRRRARETQRRQLTGFRRPDGSVGIRNKVVILPVDDLSNAVCEAAAATIPDALALPHHYGRLQFGEDLELTFRTLIGTGASPNVAAAVVVGIEPNWTARVADGIAASGKPVDGFWIEGHGDLRTHERAARRLAQFVRDASECQREPAEPGEIMMSIKCGESDTTSGLGSCPITAEVVDRWVDAGGTVLFGETSELTGGEHLIAGRCADDQTREKFQALYDSYLRGIEREGANLLGSQPTQGNIAGGLSTIEEKAMGNIAKTGSRPVVDALRAAQAPVRRGLNFMDTSSAAGECVTLMAAAGAVIHLFPTGQGNVVGHPVEPVIKLTANPRTAQTMAEHIDLDCSGLLRREHTLAESGDMLLDVVERTINGRLTCAESLGHREFVLTRLYPSA